MSKWAAKKSSLYIETEGFLYASQDQVTSTKNFRNCIIKESSIRNDCKKKNSKRSAHNFIL